jgi:hypothetical protein
MFREDSGGIGRHLYARQEEITLPHQAPNFLVAEHALTSAPLQNTLRSVTDFIPALHPGQQQGKLFGMVGQGYGTHSSS